LVRIGTAEDAPLFEFLGGMVDIDRQALRAEFRAARRALPPRQRLSAAEAVATNLRMRFPALSSPALVAGYWACDGELPLHALFAGRPPFRFLLPRLRAGKCLDFAPWSPGDPLRPNRYGIPEPDTTVGVVSPTAVDLVLLPLLGFDRSGQRLGTGGGYYDRSFAFLQHTPRPARPLLIGIGYALQEIPSLPVMDWDVGMDFVVTEREVIECGVRG
jgi:5-formyltetrahydrofolate cyclo-ligase